MSARSVSFPFPVMCNLSDEYVDRWRHFYRNPIVASRDARVEEGLWRRTQDNVNKEQSGWNCDGDKRRRMVHYEYRYDLLESHAWNGFALAMVDFYLWWHVCMPKSEIAVYNEFIYSSLQFSGWNSVYSIGHEQVFRLGDLYVRLLKYHPRENEYDQNMSRVFPDDYMILEANIFSAENSKDEAFVFKPWGILGTGIRTKDKRGSPRIDQWQCIKEFFPAQIELGCGPSIEANVPPLHFLHDIYSVADSKTGKFVLSPYKDSLIWSIISNPWKSMEFLSGFYRTCFTAEPTEFHFTLKLMRDYGHIVGPIITNNLDGLVSRVGLNELFVRRYDESHIVPRIDFHPSAKSLIVIGSHADRRRIQHAARNKGMSIVYVDPEGYFVGDEFVDYPLESPQDEDFLFRVTASEFGNRTKKVLL